MKIAFVVDTENSALFTSANQWCKFVGGEIYSASRFTSFRKLLIKLIKNQPDLVIFSWRQALDVAFLSEKNLGLLNFLKSKTQLLALVADHSADQPDRLLKDFRLSKAGIGLVTVTERLSRFYSEVGLFPVGVLPDRPDCDLIREIWGERNHHPSKGVIWVGNSQWGKRQGYKDHKGLHSKFEPFLNLAKAQGISLESKIIDSAVSKVSQREVIRSLAKSELLIVTSAAEGTCLPILEALGVGTNVISTNVGVANMFKSVRVLPINASPGVILQSYIQWEQEKAPPQEAVSDFENYIFSLDEYWEKLISQIESMDAPNVSLGELDESGLKRSFMLLVWNLKFLVKWVWWRNVKTSR
jgi:hypothetical protein